MNIEIGKLHSNLVGGTANKPASSDKASSSSTKESSTESTDRLSLTSTGADMHALEQRVASAPVIDREKIDAIKDALKRGDYPFDAQRIAEKMIDMENLLA